LPELTPELATPALRVLDDDRLNRHECDSETNRWSIRGFSSIATSAIPPLARFLQSKLAAGAVPGSAKPFEEIDMNKLTIKDLAVAKELDKRQMAGCLGGMGRTPQQILAWEVTGKPATWQGLVLEDDNRLHVPTI
jgi:hypothetical protein